MRRGAVRGFTIIEMMVSVAVVIVLMLIAVPSYQAQRQRSALRGASEDVLALWNQARMESARRNTWIKFSRNASGGNYCVGYRVATSATDTTACDCFDSSSANYCDLARWPSGTGAAAQAEWAGVTLANPTSATSLTTAVIEPKHAILGATSQEGAFAIVGPSGLRQYKLYLVIDRMGRGVLCQPTNAVDKMSDYGQRGCAP